MEPTTTRYAGPATSKDFYQNEFIVKCPRCQHSALIITTRCFNDAKLQCAHCRYAAKASDLLYYKVLVDAHCDSCGKKISRVIPHSKEKVDGFAISCSHCGSTRIYRARNEAYTCFRHARGPGVDPIFHLPLWLQQHVKGNLFWAYNRIHLHVIKQYVEAKLRERQTTGHMTMVEMLPTFIKEASNRAAILKAIARMSRNN